MEKKKVLLPCRRRLVVDESAAVVLPCLAVFGATQRFGLVLFGKWLYPATAALSLVGIFGVAKYLFDGALNTRQNFR